MKNHDRSPRARSAVPRVALAFVLAAAACSTDPSFEDGSSTSASGGLPSAASAGQTGSGGEDATTATASTGAGEGGAGTTTSNAVSAVSSSGSTVTVGSGADCTTSLDCADANPCTVDSCELDGCHNVGVAPGTAGSPTEGGCPVGVCQTDATCGLQVYAHPFGSGQAGAWTKTTVSELFGAGGNSPPHVGIVEVLQVDALDALVVFTDDGRVHARVANGAWLDPTTVAALFPGMPSAPICGYAYQPDAATPTSSVALSIAGDPLEQAYLYSVDGAGVATPEPGNPFPVDRTDEAGSPPPNAERCAWSFGLQTSFPPDASWVVLWNQVGPNVYLLDGGSLVWTDYGPAASSPVYAAGGAGPDPSAVTAAWWADGVVSFIAP